MLPEQHCGCVPDVRMVLSHNGGCQHTCAACLTAAHHTLTCCHEGTQLSAMRCAEPDLLLSSARPALVMSAHVKQCADDG